MTDNRLIGLRGLFVGTLFAILSLACGGANTSVFQVVAATQNPLVAQYNIRVPANSTAWVEFGEDTNYGRQTSVSAPTTRQQILNILVAGMRASTTYHMRAHVDGPFGSSVDSDHTFTTGPLPNVSAGTTTPLTRPSIQVSLPTPGLSPSPGVELFNLVEPVGSNMSRAFVTDLQGSMI